MSLPTLRQAFVLPAAVCAALAGLLAAPLAQAQVSSTYTATFLPDAGSGVVLDGFGRGATPGFADAVPAAPGSAPLSGRESFRDLWQIDTSLMAAGVYVLAPTTVDAAGSLLFTSVSFRSYDEAGNLDIVDFALNASGTQASGSGLFTVRTSCPVQVCVWIEVLGTQLVGSPAGEGYGGVVAAAPIPEPASVLLMLAGLGAVWGWSRRAARSRR